MALALSMSGSASSWRCRRPGTSLNQSRSSGLLLAIQNICSSRVRLRLALVASSCFWLSCRVMAWVSRLPSSVLRRSSRARRARASCSSSLRSSGVRLSPGWLASRVSTYWVGLTISARRWFSSNWYRRRSAISSARFLSALTLGRAFFCW
ncbi:hypothetical protein D3C75_882970 [compost metagenome]